MKRAITLVAVAVIAIAAATVVTLRYSAGQLASTMGQGSWALAQSELQASFEASLSQTLAGMAPPAETMNQLASCCAQKAIEFLNGTDCAYRPAAELKGDEALRQSRRGCFERVGYRDKVAEFTVACLHQHFPDDWRLMERRLKNSLVGLLSKEGVPENVSREVSGCMARKTAVLLNARKCPLKDRAAKTPEDVFNAIDDCIGAPAEDSGYQLLIKECTIEATIKTAIN